MTGAYRTLEVERGDGVVTVTMSRPERRNAATMEMWAELVEVFTSVRDNVHEDRVLVLTGAGDAFCAGADLGPLDDPVMRRHLLANVRRAGDAALALHRLPQPTIAKVRGPAVGAGANLALGCDLVLAGESARFCQVFSRRGLTIDAAGSWLLPRLVGLHRAKELAFFGDEVGAQEAARIGLANRAVPDAELDSLVEDWARRLAAGPTVALSMTKAMLSNSSAPLEQVLEDEARAQTIAFGSRDGIEGIQGFRAKREPTFRGF